MQNQAGEVWRSQLAQWAIPESILNQAPENPWIHPPVMFQIPEKIEKTISHQKAAEALPEQGSVIDVGCGGGIAAFALVPPASSVIGIDHQPEMLEMFIANANSKHVKGQTFEGFWPDVAGLVPQADVVVCHHVLYNVSKIEEFVSALNHHARNRVVIEIPQSHPLITSNALWKYFWNLERSVEPTYETLLKVLTEMGIEASVHLWQGAMRQELDLSMQAHFSRVRLCLPPERELEVANFLLKNPPPTERELATIWWDI